MKHDDELTTVPGQAFTADSKLLSQTSIVMGMGRTATSGPPSVAYGMTVLLRAYVMICKFTGFTDEMIVQALQLTLQDMKTEKEIAELPKIMQSGGDA